MKPKILKSRKLIYSVVAITCTLVLTPGQALLFARSTSQW